MPKIQLTLLLFLFLISSTNPFALQPSKTTSNQIQAISLDNLVNQLTSEQPEVNQKLLKHYMAKMIVKWKEVNGETDGNLKLRLYEGFNQENRVGSEEAIQNFLEERLWLKLDMYELTQSFQKQIKAFPEQYFLTPELYDLLIDTNPNSQSE